MVKLLQNHSFYYNLQTTMGYYYTEVYNRKQEKFNVILTVENTRSIENWLEKLQLGLIRRITSWIDRIAVCICSIRGSQNRGFCYICFRDFYMALVARD